MDECINRAVLEEKTDENNKNFRAVFFFFFWRRCFGFLMLNVQFDLVDPRRMMPHPSEDFLRSGPHFYFFSSIQ